MEDIITGQNGRETLPYEQLACIYDRIMSHVSYKHWAKYIQNLYFYYPRSVVSILDLSCGTGRILPYLKTRTRKVYGSDLSLYMLKQARSNIKNNVIPLWCNDARQLAIRHNSVDVALMLYDSINYLMEETDIIKMFGNVADVLKENGLFIFDVVTIKGCKEHFHNYYESESWDGISYVRRSWYSSQKRIQFNHFTIKSHGKTYIELHRQKIRSVAEWKNLIQNSPFDIINFYNNFTYRPIHPNSERIHIVCQRKI